MKTLWGGAAKVYLGTDVCGALLCELGAGDVRAGFRPCLGLQPMDRPGAWGLGGDNCL